MRMDRAENLDVGEGRTPGMGDDIPASARCKTTRRSVNMTQSVNDGVAGEAPRRTGEILQPNVGIGNRRRGMECESGFIFDRLDESGRRSKVIDDRTLEALPPQ